MNLWDRVFWFWFVASGVAVILKILDVLETMIMEVVVSILVIGLGLLKLSEDFTNAKNIDIHAKLVETLRWISQAIEKLMPKQSKEDEEHRMLTRKLIELENKLNEVSRAFTEEIIDLRESKPTENYLRSGDKFN